jgi:hypothetical protein
MTITLNPKTFYKHVNGETITIQASESQTAAKCEYCGKLVTATEIKYGDGTGILYSLITADHPKAVVLSRAFHHDCVSHAK